MESSCGRPSASLQQTEGLRFPGGICCFPPLVAFGFLLLMIASFLSNFHKTFPILHFSSSTPAQESSDKAVMMWGFLGASVTLPCREGCTKLGLTRDRLSGGPGQSGPGLGAPVAAGEATGCWQSTTWSLWLLPYPPSCGDRFPQGGGTAAAALKVAQCLPTPTAWDCFHASRGGCIGTGN